ncbi:ASCH domain-containing protein [Sphingomonas sp. YR710]|uniref:ASCH domain-containing protein n=1 Tax=Sphingomonas sp. YR710 TaxID=1882773 RepID=UPI00088FA6DC|nr:ASCH domain-containing protein [Sphingomonas sp. YR710]SDC30330.1 ASCH domain-containing protein [Sphingomonas sp. YR710]
MTADLFQADADRLTAISLWQPYASAIPLGLKAIETRHWKTRHRGEIAIHAARKWDGENRPFASIEHTLGRLPAPLPLGAIVAVATLVDIRPTDELKLSVSAIERLYGNYEPGRYGWMLENVRPLREPVGCIGRQSLWTLDAEVTAAVRAQLS